jgi:hypothetical protein
MYKTLVNYNKFNYSKTPVIPIPDHPEDPKGSGNPLECNLYTPADPYVDWGYGSSVFCTLPGYWMIQLSDKYVYSFNLDGNNNNGCYGEGEFPFDDNCSKGTCCKGLNMVSVSKEGKKQIQCSKTGTIIKPDCINYPPPSNSVCCYNNCICQPNPRLSGDYYLKIYYNLYNRTPIPHYTADSLNFETYTNDKSGPLSVFKDKRLYIEDINTAERDGMSIPQIMLNNFPLQITVPPINIGDVHNTKVPYNPVNLTFDITGMIGQQLQKVGSLKFMGK